VPRLHPRTGRRLLPAVAAALLFAAPATGWAQEGTPAATPVAGAARLFELPGEAAFPDGVAYDEAAGVFYVAGALNGTIFRGDIASGETEIFIPGAEGRAAADIALDDAGRLYVAGATTGQVFVFDTATGSLIASYTNNLAPNTFLNGLTVAPDGSVFVTDSFNPILYRLPAGEPAAGGTPAAAEATPVAAAPAPFALVPFVDLTAVPAFQFGQGFNANGIVATPDGATLLFVQSNTGALFRVDIAGGTVEPVDLGGDTLTGGDGMVLDGQTLYVVREGEISVVRLADDFASGEVIGAFGDPSLAVPTTAARYDGCLLVVNSQGGALAGGQPQLPFTLSGIPIPEAALPAGETATAAGGC